VPVREVFHRRAQPSRHLFNHILSSLPLRAIVIAFYHLVRFLEASFPTHVESGPRCLLARSWQSYQSWQRPRLDQERKTVSCERGTTSSPAPLPRFCSSPAAIPSSFCPSAFNRYSNRSYSRVHSACTSLALPRHRHLRRAPAGRSLCRNSSHCVPQRTTTLVYQHHTPSHHCSGTTIAERIC
jgi:hypothetical protein